MLEGKRTKLIVFAAILVGCVAAGAATLVIAITNAHSTHTPSGIKLSSKSASLATIPGTEILFRNAIPDKTFGELALASVANPKERSLTGLKCDRVYFAAGEGICLTATSSFASTYVAKLFDASFHVTHELVIPGIPSRARVSRDGKLGAMTTFVNGDSYAPGHFSTRTAIVDMKSGKVIASLEQFKVFRDGERFENRNFNFWGVTFAKDDNTFYATLGSGANTYLVKGELATKRMRVIHVHVECPSLSPDQTRIAFKRSLNSHGSWRIYVLDLRTMKEWPLAETHSVDDQVEWLDNTHIVYWRGSGVWSVRADGRGTPTQLLLDASSPTVIDPPAA